jgi:hypothetical protein
MKPLSKFIGGALFLSVLQLAALTGCVGGYAEGGGGVVYGGDPWFDGGVVVGGGGWYRNHHDAAYAHPNFRPVNHPAPHPQGGEHRR